jgi:glutaryl-CoA dehydrogenase (non-decarboxylating)
VFVGIRHRRFEAPDPVYNRAAMVDFSLTDEQRELQRTARTFAEREILPRVGELDAKAEYDRSIYERMGAAGFLGLPIPERYGGAGMDYIAFALLCEEMERADTAFRVILSVHTGLNSLTLLQWGSEEQKERYLVPQARGEKLATFGLTEPGVGSDAGNLSSTARLSGDKYILNGSKIWISLGDTADHFLVFATVDRSKGHRGVTAFIVERGFPGFSSESLHGKLGVRAGNTGILYFSDCEVPVENRVGEEGEGFTIAMSAIDQGRYTVAAGSVGLAVACLEASVKYAHERKTFGEEIGRHQLVKEMLAKMEAGTQAGRLLVWRAGWLKNAGKRNTRETSLAKWFCTDHAVAAALDAIQVHGAYGYSNEYPVERYLRNAKGSVIYEGTSQIHTLMQADYVLGYRRDRELRVPQPPWEGEA